MLLLQSPAVKRWLHKTTPSDKVAMTVFFFGGLFLLWYELWYVAAFHHGDQWSGAYLMHVGIILVLAVNIYGNWSQVFLRDSSWAEGLVHTTGPGWEWCPSCCIQRPPRSHHCPLCQTCILRHDHHCWFAGNCVGHRNQRYFFAMCVYMVTAGLYCNIYNWAFVRSIVKEITPGTILSLLVPHVTAVLGKESWFSFWFSSITTVGFALTAVFSWILYTQVLQLIRGQTRFERCKDIGDYDAGWRRNVEEILGHRGLLALLWPWTISVQPGRGVSFGPAQKFL